MQIISKSNAVFSMSAKHAPAAYAESGETVCFETLDCFGEQIQKETDHLGAIDWSRINPATGPLFVRGAMPGDTLRVDILSIELAEQAATVEAPDEGITVSHNLQIKSASLSPQLQQRDALHIFYQLPIFSKKIWPVSF